MKRCFPWIEVENRWPGSAVLEYAPFASWRGIIRGICAPLVNRFTRSPSSSQV